MSTNGKRGRFNEDKTKTKQAQISIRYKNQLCKNHEQNYVQWCTEMIYVQNILS